MHRTRRSDPFSIAIFPFHPDEGPGSIDRWNRRRPVGMFQRSVARVRTRDSKGRRVGVRSTAEPGRFEPGEREGLKPMSCPVLVSWIPSTRFRVPWDGFHGSHHSLLAPETRDLWWCGGTAGRTTVHTGISCRCVCLLSWVFFGALCPLRLVFLSSLPSPRTRPFPRFCRPLLCAHGPIDRIGPDASF